VSAVRGLTRLCVACPVGTFVALLLFQTLLSELDRLYQIRDLMCALRTFDFYSLLSAVDGTIPLKLACGIGTLMTRLRCRISTSELDYLF